MDFQQVAVGFMLGVISGPLLFMGVIKLLDWWRGSF